MGGILTFDIEESLLAEPLLNLPSGEAGGLNQPVDLTQHQVLRVKRGRTHTTRHTPPGASAGTVTPTPSLPHLFFLWEGTLGVAGPQHRELLSRLVGVNGETQHFGRRQLWHGGVGRGRRGLNDGGPLALRGNYRRGHRTLQRLSHLRKYWRLHEKTK